MSSMKNLQILTTTHVAAMLMSLGIAHAEEMSPIPVIKDEFRYAITPYVWMAGINGKLDYKNHQVADTSLSSSQILSQTDVAFFIDGEMHYGRWGVMGNAVYSKSSSLASKTVLPQYGGVSINSNTDSWMGFYTVAGTYTAFANASVYVDALAGARFMNMNSKAQLQATAIPTGYTGDQTFYAHLSATDAIAGFKGRLRIGDSRFFVPFYVDAGGGIATAKFTSQQMLGVGYTYGWVDLTLAYNNMYYSLSKNNVSSYLNMGGPAVAATFRF